MAAIGNEEAEGGEGSYSQATELDEPHADDADAPARTMVSLQLSPCT